RAVETQAVVPAVETSEPVVETGAAPTEEPAGVVEALPAEEPSVETTTEPAAEAAAYEASEETSVSLQPFVDESFEAEPAHVPEPARDEEVSGPVAEEVPEAVAETAVEPFVESGVESFVEEPAQPFIDFEEEVPEARESEDVAIEPFVGQDEEITAAGTFDFAAETRESERPALFEEKAEEATREIEPVAADASKE
ncbi:MAG TPA: hypothetical protein VF521_07390, partial [Pyrinomonadaceae bacterium]